MLSWEGFLDAAGEQQFREVQRIKNQRQPAPTVGSGRPTSASPAVMT